MVLPFIACYCICYIRNCVVFGNVVFFVLYLLGYSLVLYGFVGVGVTRYWEVMCEEGRRHKVFHKRFHKVFHEVFHKVLKSIVGSCVRQGAAQSISQSISQSVSQSITKYCEVRCEEGRRAHRS